MDDIIQGSDEWHAIRCGKVTASRVSDIIATTKSGPAASRKNYRAQLIAERLTGTTEDGFKSAAMQWGTDTEAQARETYSFITGHAVEEVSFVVHPKLEQSGASPDGLVGDDGLVEIKCPNTATHIDMLLNGVVAGKYETQMHWQMACTGRKWCDFVSFDPRMPVNMQLFIKRLQRNEEVIETLEREVIVFLAEIEQHISELNEKCAEAA